MVGCSIPMFPHLDDHSIINCSSIVFSTLRSLRFVTMDAMSYETTIHARLKVAEMQVGLVFVMVTVMYADFILFCPLSYLVNFTFVPIPQPIVTMSHRSTQSIVLQLFTLGRKKKSIKMKTILPKLDQSLPYHGRLQPTR